MALERQKQPEFVSPTDIWLLPKEEVVACLAPQIGENLEHVIRQCRIPEAQVYNLVVAAACSPHIVNGSVLHFIELQFPRNIFGWIGEREIYESQFLNAIRDTGGLLNVDALRIKNDEERARAHAERLIPGLIDKQDMINKQAAGPIREKLRQRYPFMYREFILIYILSYMDILRGMPKVDTPRIEIGESLARTEDRREKLAEEYYGMWKRRELYEEAVREGLRTLELEGLGIEDIIGLEGVGIDYTIIDPFKIRNIIVQPVRAIVACAREYDTRLRGHLLPRGVPVRALEPNGLPSVQGVVASVIPDLQEKDFFRPQAAELTAFLKKNLYTLYKICEEIKLPTFFDSIGAVVCPIGTPGSFNPFRYEPARAYALWPGEIVAYPDPYWILHEIIQLQLEAYASTLITGEKAIGRVYHPYPIQFLPTDIWSDIEGLTVAIGDEICDRMGIEKREVPYATNVSRWREELFGETKKPISALLAKVCQHPGLTVPRIGATGINSTLGIIWGIIDELQRCHPEILVQDFAAQLNSRSLDAYFDAISRFKTRFFW